MNHPPQIFEMLDAFRPGVDRLTDPDWNSLRVALDADPELRQRRAQIERSDRLIREALHSVPFPMELEETLRGLVEGGLILRANEAKLSPPTIATAVALATADHASEGSSAVELPQKAPRERRRLSRRAWGAAIGGVLSLASLLALGGIFWPAAPAKDALISRQELEGNVQQWLADSGLQSSSGWSLNVAGSVAKSYPIDAAIQARPTRWRKLSDSGQSVAVYELRIASGKTGYLFVQPTDRAYNVPTLPLAKWFLTGSHAVGSWQRPGLLYVLVVDEDGVSIEDFVRIPRVA